MQAGSRSLGGPGDVDSVRRLSQFGQLSQFHPPSQYGQLSQFHPPSQYGQLAVPAVARARATPSSLGPRNLGSGWVVAW
jgi:hypothetical protein